MRWPKDGSDVLWFVMGCIAYAFLGALIGKSIAVQIAISH